jgi:transcriptional regulator with XRE-family HTH domain
MAWDKAFEALGQQLHYLREVAGVTLTEAARLLGTSKGYLSSVERGRDRPSARTVQFYEEEFGGDGQAWGLYVAALTADRPRQRRSPADRALYPVPGDASTFVADITIPDGTVMQPYHKFNKVWRVRNSGTVLWEGRWLARVGAPSGHGIPTSPKKVRIPDTQPGEEADLVVPMQSQALAGSSQASFKMVDEDGREYFPDCYPLGLVVSIVVDGNGRGPDLPRPAK